MVTQDINAFHCSQKGNVKFTVRGRRNYFLSLSFCNYTVVVLCYIYAPEKCTTSPKMEISCGHREFI